MVDGYTRNSSKRLSGLLKSHEQDRTDLTGGRGQQHGVIPFLFRRFELAEDLDPSSTTVDAHPLNWDTETEAYVADTDEDKTFLVSDPTGSLRGRKKDKFSSPNDQGNRGWAMKPHDVDLEIGKDRWEILRMQPNALLIRGQATANWTASTMTIDGVVVMQPDGGLITDQDPGGDITVTDFFDWDGSENDDVFAYWDAESVTWKQAMVPC